MIVVDTSVLVAIMSDEPERRAFNERIATEEVRISAANLLEARIVLFARFGEDGVRDLDVFLLRSRMIVVEVSPRSGDLAFEAYRRYGRGTGHPAGLNYGDCFAYALAKESGAPLLFKGDDFSRTDIPAASATRPSP